MSDDHHHHQAEPLPQRTLDAAADGCEESRLFISRRAFMGLSASFSAWAFAPRMSSATEPGEEHRLLIVMLQGGMDGLHIAAPLGDPAYQSARGSMAQTHDSTNPLDGQFYLTKAMPTLWKLYNDRQAAIIHAIAPPLRIGSHFECMYNLQSGYPGQLVRTATSGWLNRLVSVVPAGNPVRGRGLVAGSTMLLAAGPAPMMSWRPSNRYGMESYQPFINLYKQYGGSDLSLADTLRRGVETNLLATSSGDAPASMSTLEKTFRGAGILLGQRDGPRVAAIEFAGFDTHTNEAQGLSTNLSSVDAGLKAFKDAIGPAAWAKTVVVCCSEFGRTVYANGRDGTDHGIGGIAFVLGGAVSGGKVIADWPGLGQSQLQGGNLRATTDTRAVFKGILQDHLGVPRSLLDTQIFPDSKDVTPADSLIASPVSVIPASQSSPSASMQAEALGSSALRAFRRANGAS